MAIEELFADERLLVAYAPEVVICGWRDAPTEVQMRAMAEHGRRIEQAHGPAALLNIAFSGVPKFSDEVRSLATQYTRDPTLFARCRAHVVIIGGFRGAAVMAFINTFLLLGHPPRPTKVFRAIPPAIDFVAQHVSLGDAELAAAVEDVRWRIVGA